MTAAHLEAMRGTRNGEDERRDHVYSDCGHDDQYDSISGDHGIGDNRGGNWNHELYGRHK